MRITQPLTPLHATRTPKSTLAAVGRMLTGTTREDRRTRPRLRELCDEVLASFRLAAGQDLFSDDDRQAALALTPALATRRAR